MSLPFTQEQFLDVFRRYNEAVWPAQWVAAALCLAMFLGTLSKQGASAKMILFGLSAMWVWNGIAYHWMFFAPINPAARLFAAMFVVQGLLLAVVGLRGAGRAPGVVGARSV